MQPVINQTKRTEMKAKSLSMIVGAACCAMMISCSQQVQNTKNEKLLTVGNPYLPLWEHIPDGEPYVFDDHDVPGN